MPRKKPEIVVLSREERLRESKRQATSMSLPLAVHHRLEILAEMAVDVGATRAEIIGMLISQAELNPGQLESAILAYRKLSVGDVVPEEPAQINEPQRTAADNVISIEKRGPGRPGRRETA